MNDIDKHDQDSLRAFLLMTELEKGEPISQREIAGRLGIALGLVNSYLKSLVKKGMVQVKAYPRNQFAYLLTPKGVAEKSHLAYLHLSNYHKLYRITRQDSMALFRGLQQRGVKQVRFCGVDYLTEITYLSLCEAGLELSLVMDVEAGDSFLGRTIVSIADGVRDQAGPIVITCLPRAGELKAALLEHGVAEEDIYAPIYSYKEILKGESRARG